MGKTRKKRNHKTNKQKKKERKETSKKKIHRTTPKKMTMTMTTTTNMQKTVEKTDPQQQQQQQLPVIIAGAGPCGLVAALTLQQDNVPFVLYERASSRQKLCSNTGSGIDMAPTAVDILQNKLIGI